MAEKQHEVVFCIVNEGFSEAVMDAAREAGARGGTVLNARGTASVEAEKKFGIVVEPQKEIVMILVDVKIKEAVLKSLYEGVGLKTAGQGIAFTLPVSEVVGLTPHAKQPKVETKETSAVANSKVSHKEEKTKEAAAPEQQKKGE